MMKYKLIVSDFDGTLTRADGTVPAENIAAIKRFRDAGGIFTISTGRMYGSIIQQLDRLGLCLQQEQGASLPIVSYQGALITDAASGRVLHAVPMNRGVVHKILKYCKAQRLYCHFYSFDRFYTEHMTEHSRAYAAYTKTESLAVEAGDLSEFLDAHPDIPVCKVLIIDEAARIEQIGRDANRFFNGDAVFCRSAEYLTECVDAAAGKGNALRWLATHYGIPIGQVVGIGDSENDLSMLQDAGFGVAMGNASDELKQIANYVTGRAEHAGLAQVIDKVLDDTL